MVKALWRHIKEFEPARLREIAASVVALLAALGVHYDPAMLPEGVSQLLILVAAGIAIVQGESTRRNVYSKGRVELRLGHDGPENERTLP